MIEMTSNKVLLNIGNFIKLSYQAEKAVEAVGKASKGTESVLQTMSKKGSQALKGMASQLKSAIGLSLDLKQAMKLAGDGLNAANTQRVQQNRINAIAGKEKGTQIYQKISDYDKGSVFGRETLAQGFISFSQYTKDYDTVKKMYALTERLYALDPKKGADQAFSAMTSAMGGDTQAMASTYGVAGMSDDQMASMAGSGDLGGMLEYIDEELNAVGATQELVTANTETLTAQLDNLSASFTTALGASFQNAMGAMLPMLQQLSSDLAAGKFQPFFDAFAAGVQFAVQGLAWIANNILWLLPLIGAMGAAWLGYKAIMAVVTIVTAGQSIATNLANVSMKALNVTALASSWWLLPLLMAVAAGSFIFGALTKQSNKANKQLGGQDPNALPPELEAMAKMPDTPKFDVDANVTNDALPIKGDVQIEEDNLVSLLEIAERDYIARFSTATLAPQFSVNIAEVKETADVDNLMSQLENRFHQLVQNEQEGVYA